MIDVQYCTLRAATEAEPTPESSSGLTRFADIFEFQRWLIEQVNNFGNTVAIVSIKDR